MSISPSSCSLYQYVIFCLICSLALLLGVSARKKLKFHFYESAIARNERGNDEQELPENN